MKITHEDAKRRLPIAQTWRLLGIPGDAPERDGKNIPCPWPQNHRHADKHPSFGTYQAGTRFKCHGCGAQGDAVELVALWKMIPRKEAFRRFMELAEHGGGFPANTHPPSNPSRALIFPPLRHGTPDDLREVANSRGILENAVSLAQTLRCVRFATVCDFPSWVLTDDARKVAEARRIDGKPYPAHGGLGERKAHTLRGSRKNWPVGVSIFERCPRARRNILLVEGGPDFLAALHFIIKQDKWNAVPIALLGRQTGRSALDPHALDLMRGRRVRIYPHADIDGGGMEAAHAWAAQLARVGCAVDFFDFEGLKRRDGDRVKDLNDAALICREQQTELENILP